MNNNVSHYENEVAYFSEFVNDTADLKAAVWSDEDFKDYLSDVGLKETLYEVTSFARSIQENLRTNKITDLTTAPPWATKAVRLLATVKSRRQQLRRVVREMYGEDAVQEIQDRVDAEVED